jgi:hypothetical protein
MCGVMRVGAPEPVTAQGCAGRAGGREALGLAYCRSIEKSQDWDRGREENRECRGGGDGEGSGTEELIDEFEGRV